MRKINNNEIAYGHIVEALNDTKSIKWELNQALALIEKSYKAQMEKASTLWGEYDELENAGVSDTELTVAEAEAYDADDKANKLGDAVDNLKTALEALSTVYALCDDAYVNVYDIANSEA